MKDDNITKEFKQRMQETMHLNTTVYYWIWGLEGGRRVLCGPKTTEDEAYQWGFANLSGDFEVIPLKTRDEATASRILRARLLEETNTDTAFKRFKHQTKESAKTKEA